MDEVWKPIAGYEGYYEVSSYGNVRSLDRLDSLGRRRAGTILKPQNLKSSYGKVDLRRNGTVKQYRVHKLVAITFFGDRSSEGLIVLHGPNGYTDNSVSNLSWGTHSDNEYDKQRDGTSFQVNKTFCPREHSLIFPNLIANRKHRACLACSRAKAYHRLHPELDLNDLADNYYRKIMI